MWVPHIPQHLNLLFHFFEGDLAQLPNGVFFGSVESRESSRLLPTLNQGGGEKGKSK